MISQIRKLSFVIFLSVALSGVFAFGLQCKSLFPKSSAKTRSIKPVSDSIAMTKFRNGFGTKKPVIGMIHLAGRTNAEVVRRAMDELAQFGKLGVHAAIIVNYHGNVEQVELVLAAIQGKFSKIKIGVNILPNEYDLAFALARQYGASFIQLDFVSGRYGSRSRSTSLDVADYMAYREEYSEILVLGGVHPKYYTPVPGSDLVQDIIDATERADAVVVTGAGTGKETPLDKILKFRKILGSDFPLVIGAGMTADNASIQLPVSEGVIVGSYFKNGYTQLPVDTQRVKEFMTVHSSVLKNDPAQGGQ